MPNPPAPGTPDSGAPDAAPSGPGAPAPVIRDPGLHDPGTSVPDPSVPGTATLGAIPANPGPAATIEDRLTAIFREIFLDDDLVLSPQTTAADVPGWDSFRQVEVILAVEACWAIRLGTRDLDALHSVGDLTRVIRARTDAPQATTPARPEAPG